jgi:hypothetical protein
VKVVHFTEHATFTITLRAIDPAWIERALRSPAWTSVDPRDPSLRRAFAPVPERGGRYLRVVYSETPEKWVIVTAFLDRDAKPPRMDR